jgi:hypothetical protein
LQSGSVFSLGGIPLYEKHQQKRRARSKKQQTAEKERKMKSNLAHSAFIPGIALLQK